LRNQDSCCIVSLTFPTRDPRNFDQRFRCDLDLTAQITSGFFISRNWDFCCIVSLTFPTRDPRNYDQRSRCDLDLTAQITLGFFISRNRDSCCIVSLTFPTRILETPINSLDVILIGRLRLRRGFHEPSTPCTFKDHAGFPQSNNGQTLHLDLTPVIYPPLQCTLLVFIQI
jgi:hypothetical protein